MWFMDIPISICLCKRVTVQCVNTLNYYDRRIKLHTMLWNVCNVVLVTPGGYTENLCGHDCEKGLAISKP